MDVTITVARGATGVRADVRLHAADTEPAAPLLDDLRRLVGAAADEPVHTDGAVLDPGSTAAGWELADGQVLTVGHPIAASRPHRQPGPAGLVLAVVAGPVAGSRVRLDNPRTTVGRDPSCTLTLDDAAVSRCHLAVTVDPEDGRVTVEDLGSRNGTAAAGRPLVAHRPVRLEPGQPVRVGGCELVVSAAAPPARLVPMPGGRLAVHRSPRTPGPPKPVEIRLPPAPTAPTPTRLPVLAAVAPLVIGVLLALLLHQWQLLAFTVLSPVMVAGQAVSDRRSSRRTHRKVLTTHARDLAAAGAEVDAALAEERVRRHAAAPDLAAMVGAAIDRSAGLWQRGRDDPDALRLRLGRGEPPSEVTVLESPRLAAEDVPVCVALRDAGILGVAGPVSAATALARSLVLQAVTQHGPSHCRLVVIAPGRIEEWAWARWLPHTVPGSGEACAALFAADERQARARLAELSARDDPPGSPATLLLIDATAAPGAGALDDALDVVAGPCTTIWLAADPARLPAGCRTVVTVGSDPAATLTLVAPGIVQAGIRGDLVSRAVAETAARSLAPLRDSDGIAAAAIPASVSWSELTALDLSDRQCATAGLMRSWLAGPSTAVPLGRGAGGDVVVDLAADGPHALVAGTTGSGKSELLQTLVAGLAAANRPDDLALLLVDFKGGAAFGSCRRLPHTVGVVTDLDTASTGRALTSLEAELRRRERVLAELGVADLDGYAAAAVRTPDAPPRPSRLVIVVDEFATLVEELPDFVGGLVGIAQRGRSLGVHLVLATQRPEGVVSPDIRANTRLRICLAVGRASDSRDVIDGPQAAAIGRGTPGRAYLRAGPGELTAMQTARVSGTTGARVERVTLSPAAHLGRPPVLAANRTDAAAHTDLDRLADAAIEAAHQLGCAPPTAPWLAPLPEQLSVGELPTPAPGQAAWALVDLPAEQRQSALTIDLATGGTLLIAGTARSGRTTALRSMVLAAAAALPPDLLHLWAVDGGGGLASLETLPHGGGVVPAHDVDRLDRLLTTTLAEVTRRRRDGWAGQPLLLLAVDGWEAMLAQAGDHDGGRLVESLLRLAADGPGAGLRLVVTAGRSGLTGRLGAVAPERLVLRLPERSDFGLLGMASRDVPPELPAGRAIRSHDLALVQVAVPDGPTVARATAWPRPATGGVRRVDALPQVVNLADIAAPPGAAGVLRLGLRAEDRAPALHDPADGGGALLVAGPQRSGRSSALVLIATQLAGFPVAVVCPRRSPLAGLDARSGVVALPVGDQEHAVAMLDAMTTPDDEPPTVLVDDVDLLVDGPLTDRIATLARAARDARNLVVLAGPTDALIAAFRGPVPEARRAGAGVLLRPSGPHDGELFGVRLPRRDARHDPPGRGWLALHGEAVAIQLATATATPAVQRSGGGDRLLRHRHGAGLLR